MPQPDSSLRQSPFIFIVRITFAEFLFSMLLLFVTASTASQFYAQTDAADVVSFPLLLGLMITLLQVLIIFLTFLSWYFPIYRLAPAAILQRSGPFAQERPMVNASNIRQITVRQNWLGRRLGYGTVRLTGQQGQSLGSLKRIQDPEAVADLIHAMAPADVGLPELLNQPIPTLVTKGEGEFLEFKASLMWDYRKQSVNKELYEPVMKNLVAFMNGNGGMLLVGIGDDGEILGIEQDMSTLRKPGVDGFENVFNVAFGNMIGVEYRPFVTLDFPSIQDKTVCSITVRPASHPAYLRHKGKEEFYLRTGNASNALPVSKAIPYAKSRFQ